MVTPFSMMRPLLFLLAASPKPETHSYIRTETSLSGSATVFQTTLHDAPFLGPNSPPFVIFKPWGVALNSLVTRLATAGFGCLAKGTA